SRLPDLRSDILDERELRRAGCCRCVHDCVEPDATRGPCRCCTVVAGRGGHDGAGLGGRVAVEHGQRATPLEGAQWVHILPLEEHAPACECGLLEGGRRHAKIRPALPSATSAIPAASTAATAACASITGASPPKTRQPEPQASPVSRSARGPQRAG